jgi:hypothetical protein
LVGGSIHESLQDFVTVKSPKRVVLADVHFESGETVEVLMLGDKDARVERRAQLRDLPRETQALPQVQTLTDEDIAAEVAAHRRGE